MGFHRRYLADENIIASALRNDFHAFQTMMTNADDYMFEEGFAHCFWEFFYKEKDAREHIWNLLRSEESNRDKLIQIVCKSWEIVSNYSNNPDQLDAINNYLDLAEEVTKDPDSHLVQIVKILRKRIKEI